MWKILQDILSPSQYMPHGSCYLWQSPLIWLHVTSDLFIAIAYFSIPTLLIYFVRKRNDVPFMGVFLLFGLFIILCGTGHLLEIWTLWHPAYWLSGIEQALTAFVSCLTAAQMVVLLPQFLALKTPEELEKINQELQQEIKERQRTEEILHSIVTGTAAVTGEKFFPALVNHLARALNIYYVAISENVDQNLKTLAIWIGDRLTDNFEYALAGTPCEVVTDEAKPCWYPENLQELFPEAPLLPTMNAVSYFGVPLLDEQHNVIGNLCIIDTRPLFVDDRTKGIVQVFAARAAAELQRQKATEALAKTKAELEQRVDERTADLAHANTTLQQIAEQEKTINYIWQQMRQTLDMQAIFDTTTKELRVALECDRLVVYYFAANSTGELFTESVALGWTPLRSCPLPLEELYQAIANQYNNPLNSHPSLKENTNHYTCIPDIETSGLDPSYLQQLRTIEARSYLIVPIFCQQQLWGLLCAYQNSQPRSWEEANIKILSKISSQLGVAVQQAELFKQTQQQAEELAKARDNADAANRAKSEFLANMTHELRTPLNAILGFSQLMNGDRTLSEKSRQYTDIINSSGEHLLTLINDILEMSKIEAGRTILQESQFNLHHLLESLQKMLSLKAAAKNLELQFQRESNVPEEICTDQSKLRQVLINLLGNAIKFTQTGSVTLYVQSIMETDRSKLYFAVEDTGPGITPEEQDKLFAAFEQTQIGISSQEGTGLGLPISQKFVQVMGGQINVENPLDGGAKFSFTIDIIPVSQSQQQTPVDTINDPDNQLDIIGLAPNQPSYRILVVEDNPTNRLLLVDLLERLGFAIETANNGIQGITLWKCWQPHLILMDLQMPEMDGYETTRRIRQNESENREHYSSPIPIIALTASAFEETRQTVLEQGFDDFVRKPFHEQYLLQKIGDYLGVTYCYGEKGAEIGDRSSLEVVDTHDVDTHGVDINSSEAIETALAQMSPQWRQELYYSAAEGSDESIAQLITQIPAQHSTLISKLTTMVIDFRFDRIMELVKTLNKDTE